MKKYLLILMVLIGLSSQAQMPFPIDTTPMYRYLFINDSIGFIDCEYLVRINLITQGGKMLHWDYPKIDTITHTVYACETPEPIRFINIPDLAPIKEDILAFARGLETLAQLKSAAQSSSIPDVYKDLIQDIELINVKKYRVNLNFKNFKEE